MAESGCEKAWWDKLRRPYLKNLERVMSDLQEGRDVRQLDLRRALFLLLRDNKFAAVSLFVTKCSSDENVAKSERSLSEASSTVAALRLPRKKDGGIPTSTLFLLTFRGAVSKLHSASGCHPSAPFDPWAWLELLVQYATQLEGKLELLASTSAATPRRGGRHAEQGVDDECLLLATLSALALRAVKTSFRSSYVDIPWEEVEFVLVSFIEAHTVYESWAFVFATVSTVLRYLRDLKPLLAVFKAQRFGQAMKTLSKAPSVTRPAFLAGLKASGDAADRRKAAMFQGCAVVRDYESLETIKEALEVAIGALGMSEADYRQHGCLAFHRALFVVGERMKNTWESPNLSDRYGKLIETMASENLVATMKRIRNGLAHPAGAAESSAAAKLASKEAKRRMATDLSSIVETVEVLLYDAEWDLLQGLWDYTAPHCDANRALRCILRYMPSGINPIDAELSRLLDSISRRNPKVAETVFHPFEECKEYNPIYDHARALFRHRYLYGVGGTPYLSSLLNLDLKRYEQEELCQLISTVPFSKDVAKFVRLWRLYRSGEEIADFRTSLVDGSEKKPPRDDVALALVAIQSAEGHEDNVLMRYRLEGAVRIVASSWQQTQDRGQPVASLYAPCLYGRHLRNYLNHGDKFIQVCLDPDSEIMELCQILAIEEQRKNTDMQRGAQPRPVPLAEARAEHDRLLRLVQLKCGMFRSALAGDVAGVARAAEAGADVASRDSQGRTLLHAAAAAGQEAVVRWLLALGPQAVQPAAVDWLGRTALHEASSAAVAEALLQAGLPVEVWDLRLQTPLSRAASGGRVEVVRLLLGHPWRADHSAPDLHSGRKPMHWAAWHGHVEVLQLLLEAGATCEAVGVDAVTPLRLAARGGHADAVRFLLGPRARPRPSDQECVDAIGAAAISGRAVAFNVLLEEVRRRTPASRWAAVVREFQSEVFEGGDKDVIDVFLRECPGVRLGAARLQSGVNLLEHAASVGAEHSVRALLARGLKPTARRHPMAMTALHYAIQGCSLGTVRAILEHIPKGHSLRTGCGELISPLCVAICVNRFEVVQLLVQEGADLNVPPSKLAPATPLLLAAKFGHAEAVSFLLERGAGWQPTAAAWTPLHAAALGGHFGVVKVLVPAGTPGDAAQCRQSLALVQCADESGWTALLCALWSGSAAVVKYLLRREAELLQHGLAGRRCSALQRDKGGRSVLELCALWGCAVDLVEPVLAFLKDHGPAAGLSAEELLASVKDVQGKIQEGRTDGGQMGPLLVKWISLLEPQPVADIIAPFQALGIAPPKALEMETQRKAEETGQSSAFCEGEGLKKSAEENHQDPTENTAVAGKAAPSALGVAPTKSRKNKKKKSKGRNQKSSQRSVVPDGKAFEKNTADNDQNASINPTAHASEGSLPVGRVAEAKEGDCTLEQQPVAESLDSALALPKALNKERKKSKDAYQNSAACDGEGLVKDTEESDQPVPENSDFPDSVDWLVVDAVADLANITNVNNMAFKMKIIQMVLWKGVRRLSSLWCPNDPVWSKALLQAAAPTLEALHVRVVQAEHLAVIHAMPRLRRLYVASDPVLYANPVTLPPLPAGHPGGLHWVRAYMPIATWASLVRGHAHSLREVVLCAGTRGPPGYEDHYPYACTDLSPVFQGRALPALRRVVVWRSSSFVHDKSDCRVQLAAIRAVLGASVSVVCNRCVEVRQDEFHELCEGEQCRRVFVVPE